MEFAVVLPLLVLMLFGIVEFGWLFMIRQTLVNAAREGCRVAILKTATSDDVAARVREVMQPLEFSEGTDWNFTASGIDDVVQWIRVESSFEAVALTGSLVVPDGTTITGECSMRKEGAATEEIQEGVGA